MFFIDEDGLLVEVDASYDEEWDDEDKNQGDFTFVSMKEVEEEESC